MVLRGQYTGYKIWFWVTEACGFLAFLLLAVWVFAFKKGLAWNTQPKVQFNWHALCMPLALVFLCSHELMLFRMLRFHEKRLLKLLHAGFTLPVVFLLVIGYWAVLDAHNYQGKANWYSLHSWMGILVTLLYFLQGFLGCASFLWPGAPIGFRAAYKPLHVFVGLTIFVLSTATALLGLFEEIKSIDGYRTFSGEGIMMNLCGMFFVVYTILVVFIQTRPEYIREPLVTD